MIPFRRVAIGRLEEAMHPSAFLGAVAEFISVFIFVFVGEGSILALGKLTGDDGLKTPAGLVLVALAHGLAFVVAVAVAANASGGHVNPAVTFGCFVGGSITLLRGILYWIAQLLGATAAAGLLIYTTNGMKLPVFSLSVDVGDALVWEIVLTFGLVYTVYATAVDTRRGSLGIIAPICSGFIVSANILVGGAFYGACMNPALAFGPALVSWRWKHHWIFWVGPLVGGGFAGLIYDLFFIPDDLPPERLPSSDF